MAFPLALLSLYINSVEKNIKKVLLVLGLSWESNPRPMNRESVALPLGH